MSVRGLLNQLCNHFHGHVAQASQSGTELLDLTLAGEIRHGISVQQSLFEQLRHRALGSRIGPGGGNFLADHISDRAQHPSRFPPSNQERGREQLRTHGFRGTRQQFAEKLHRQIETQPDRLGQIGIPSPHAARASRSRISEKRAPEFRASLSMTCCSPRSRMTSVTACATSRRPGNCKQMSLTVGLSDLDQILLAQAHGVGEHRGRDGRVAIAGKRANEFEGERSRQPPAARSAPSGPWSRCARSAGRGRRRRPVSDLLKSGPRRSATDRSHA